MKKAILLQILSLVILGQWGCSQKITPFAPIVASPSATSTPVPQASYAAQWTYAGTSMLNTPVGIAVDGSQVVYVTDSFLGEVLKYNMNGDLMAQWGKGGSDNLDQPSGIAVHNGNVYVADSANARVVEYDPNGAEIAVVEPKDFNGDLFAYPTGVSFDNLGNLYVSDNSDVVYQFNTSLVLTAQWGDSGNTAGKFNYPVVTAEDNSGDVYVVANNSDAIFKYNPTTTILNSWGTTGSSNGQFYGPSDVKLDAKGNVFVVDTGNDRIQAFTPNGVYLTQFGQSGTAGQSLSEPNAMAFDSNGNAYVADTGNSRIVKYSMK